jgi:hypothetical protein
MFHDIWHPLVLFCNILLSNHRSSEYSPRFWACQGGGQKGWRGLGWQREWHLMKRTMRRRGDPARFACRDGSLKGQTWTRTPRLIAHRSMQGGEARRFCRRECTGNTASAWEIDANFHEKTEGVCLPLTSGEASWASSRICIPGCANASDGETGHRQQVHEGGGEREAAMTRVAHCPRIREGAWLWDKPCRRTASESRQHFGGLSVRSNTAGSKGDPTGVAWRMGRSSRFIPPLARLCLHSWLTSSNAPLLNFPDGCAFRRDIDASQVEDGAGTLQRHVL